MTVIPRTPVLQDWECICEMVARCDWTLGDTVDAVKLHGVQLSQSVPMNARPIGVDTCVWQLVVDCDVKYLRLCQTQTLEMCLRCSHRPNKPESTDQGRYRQSSRLLESYS
jgi:hypothetical protein